MAAVQTAKRPRRGYLRIFASYYKPHWKLFALDMVCALCICLVDLAFPVASRFAMQTLLPQQAFRAFFAVMAVLAGAYVLKGFSISSSPTGATCWACAWRRTSDGICSPTCRSCPSPSTTRTVPASS